MAFIFAAFLIGFTMLTGIVLADSFMRFSSATGAIAGQRKLLEAMQSAELPDLRLAASSRGAGARLNAARTVPLRAAA